MSVAAIVLALELVTLGPTESLYSGFGHALVCARGDTSAAPEAPYGEGDRCFDYGVPVAGETGPAFFRSLRGHATFAAAAVPAREALANYARDGRSIDVQRLALSEAEASRLLTLLEGAARARTPYAFHPYRANCTTMLRDRIDEATDGRLRPGRETPATRSFRHIAEAGVARHLGALTLLALVLGQDNDRVPDGWEIAFLPSGLRETVAERLGGESVRVSEARGISAPPSPLWSRVVLVGLAVALAALVERGRARPRVALVVVAAVLGGLGLVVDGFALFARWPELTHNWVLALLVPVDLAMPLLRGPWLARYARARILAALALVFAELAGVIAQPILIVASLVVLPMWAIQSRQKIRA